MLRWMPRPPHLRPPIAGKSSEDGIDRAMAELAHRQHGVVSRAQLMWLGYTRHEIDRRIALGDAACGAPRRVRSRPRASDARGLLVCRAPACRSRCRAEPR